jgi:GMP synthase-like glutamine amidotransferase
MRALVLEHQSNCGLGRLEGPLARRLAFDVATPESFHELGDPRSYRLVITLGSDRSAVEDSVPWVPAEHAFVREAVGAGVPVLGICFGAQMLARALGADVYRADVPEVGWKSVARAEPATPWLPAGPWLIWHEDFFRWPPGASRLAWSDAAPQAFRREHHLGLQFHPEATHEMIDSWLEADGRKLAAQGVDVDALRRETSARDRDATAAAGELFESYLDQVLG